MRISDYFGGTTPAQPQLAEVTVLRGGKLVTQGSDYTEGVPVISPYGVTAMPAEGEKVLLMPCGDYYVCIGTMGAQGGLPAGELVLKSKGGACVELKNSGDVVINGLTITSEGQLVPKAAQ